MVMPHRPDGTRRGIGVDRRLGHEERVSARAVRVGDVAVVRNVHVGREHLNGGRDRSPHPENARVRPARGEAARLVALVEPAVGGKGQSVRSEPGLGNKLHVGSHVIGREHLLGHRAEDLLPRALAGAFVHSREDVVGKKAPHAAKPREEVLGDRRREGGVRLRRVFARCGHLADLVLDLHAHDRADLAVGLAQIRHQGRERAGIGRARLVAEKRERSVGEVVEVEHADLVRARNHLGAREAPEVALDPCRRVVALRVLPGTEPQKPQAKAALAGGLEHHVDRREIEHALHRLQ